MSNALTRFRTTNAAFQLAELEAAEAAGIDALVAIYHVDHRELCAHERDWPFRIINILDIVGASMGLHHDDHFKRLKIMQDADAIVADCKDMIDAYRIDPAMARSVVVKAMLNEQPLPLVGQRLDRARAQPICPAMTMLFAAKRASPPPCHHGTGVASSFPVPPDLRPRHISRTKTAVGLLPVVL